MHFIEQVKKRPEIPEQDNDKMGDGQAAELAWKHHQLCNESIIVELFQVCSSDSLTALIKEHFFTTNYSQQLMIHVPTRIFAWLAFITNVFYSVLNYTCLYFVCNRRLMLDTTKSLFTILMRPIIKFGWLMFVYRIL